MPALVIQVKTALKVNRKGLAAARMAFPEGKPREHSAFIYAVVYVVDATIAAAWIVASADFDRLAYWGPGKHGRGIELEFLASPARADKWSPYRCGRLELGSRLEAIIESLPSGPVPQIRGAHVLLRRRS